MRPTTLPAALASLGVLSLALGACAVGPDYERPDFDGTTHDLASLAPASSSTGTTFTQDAPWEQWWAVFGDTRLDELVREARDGNQDLRAAVARVWQARAVKSQAFGPLFPQFSMSGQGLYTKQSKASFLLPPEGLQVPGISAIGAPYTLFTATADAGWELDLWGKFRRGIEAAGAEAQATVEDARAAEIALTADVVTTYFDLGAAESGLAIAREACELRQQTLAFVQARVKTGFAGELELRRAEGELEAARAEVPESERQRLVAEHALALLLGRTPDVTFQGGAPAAFALPPRVPVGLPATLLERRPDVRAAELRVRGANAQIGQAIADYFPQVTIVGRFGFAATKAALVHTQAASLFEIGPSIHLPLFEGGRTYFTVLEREAATDGAAAHYRSTILNALREVADSLAAIACHSEVRDHQAAMVVSVERAQAVATASYRNGLTGYLNVLDAQRSLLQSRQALLQTQRQVIADLVSLQKALGGGWTVGKPAEDAGS